MTPLSDLLRRIRGSSTRELERQIEAELEAHLEMLRDEYVAGGLDPDAAAARARSRFGSVEQYRAEGLEVRGETERHERRVSLVADLGSDVRFALRGLRRDRTFAAVSISTLGLGIGAAAAVFAVVHAILLRPLPFEEPDRLVVVHEVFPLNGNLWSLSGALLGDLERADGISAVAAINRFPNSHVNLTGGREPRRVPADRVSANFFDLLGVRAALGRTLLPSDDGPAAEPVAVLSHDLWASAFGEDPGIVGRTVRIDEEPHQVIGVMPPGFAFTLSDGSTPLLWRGRAVDEGTLGDDDRGNHFYSAVARLRRGVTLVQAQAEMDALAVALAEAFPETNTVRETGEPWGIRLTGLHASLIEPVRPSLLVLAGGVGVVLLIAWVNVTNLLMARSATRRRELSVRSAIGAGRWRVARQLMTETLVLGALGGVVGVALAAGILDAVVATAPPPPASTSELDTGAIPLLSRIGMSGWVLVMTFVTCGVSALACGLPTVVALARRDPNEGIRGENGGSKGRRVPGAQLLAAAETSLALVLLIGFGLLMQTMRRVYEVPLGFQPEGAHVIGVRMAEPRYATLVEGDAGTRSERWSLRPEHRAFVEGAVRAVAALPSVEAAGAVNVLPFQSTRVSPSASVSFPGLDREARGSVEGVPVHGRPFVGTVTPDYFRAMGIEVLAGRSFMPSDDRGAPAVAILNDRLAAAARLSDPVGTTIMVRLGAEWRTAEVVGVVATVHKFGLSQQVLEQGWSGPMVYLPFAQTADRYGRFQIGFHMTANVVARHRGDPDAIGAAMLGIVRGADPETPISFVRTLEEHVDENVADRRFHLLLIGTLAIVALLLAIVGVYGVMAFQVGRRVHEIGVRMALGARADGVVTMIVGEGARVALLGVLVGVAGAMGVTRLLSPWLWGVTPTEPAVFAALSALVLGVASLACWVPARRAARVDPVESLRAE